MSRSCRSRWEALKAAVMAETADIETTIQAIRSRRNRSTHRRSSVASASRGGNLMMYGDDNVETDREDDRGDGEENEEEGEHKSNA